MFVSVTTVQLPDLQFNVSGLLKGPIGGTRSYDLRVPVSELDQLDEGFDVSQALEGAVRLLRTNDTILARLRGTLAVQLDCGRCLEPFEAPLAIVVEEEFYPSVDVLTGRPLPDTGDDVALVIDEHHILDMSEVVRQAILLELPLSPLCREDCAGLCPVCGANRNLETCTCVQEPSDLRWTGLKTLVDLQADEK